MPCRLAARAAAQRRENEGWGRVGGRTVRKVCLSELQQVVGGVLCGTGLCPGSQAACQTERYDRVHIDRRPFIFNFVLVAVLLAVFGGGERASAQCAAADINNNGVVDGTDLTLLLSAWGSNNADADIDGSGLVGGTDLTALLASWGPRGSCVPSVPAWATLLEADPDPAVVTDATLRARITATGLAWRVKDTATQIEMVLIPPGTFNMGCSASQQFGCYSSENPVHQVTLQYSFYLGRYEVTQAQWTARMGSNPSQFQSASAEVPLAQVPQRPVETVSWDTIQGFLNQTGMRLPTEAEWEYAYRAGTTTAFHGYTGQLSGTNDDSLLGNIAWFGSNANSQTRPVGGKLGNGFGLHDMSGNVWEWVKDLYGDYSADAQTNPQGPSGGYSLMRGGAYYSGPYGGSVICRASYRFSRYHGISDPSLGFRAARTP